MPPHLHPRSRTTSTLFTTCLTLSFVVVGLPHILPSCPVDQRQFTESGGPKNRRRKGPSTSAVGSEAEVESVAVARAPGAVVHRGEDPSRTPTLRDDVGIVDCVKGMAGFGGNGVVDTTRTDPEGRIDGARLRSTESGSDPLVRRRECPVPKPRGLIARVMGFGDRGAEGVDAGKVEESSVVVKPVRGRGVVRDER